MTDPTPRPQVFCIDEKGRQATVSIGWLLEHEHAAGTHPICPNNQAEFNPDNGQDIVVPPGFKVSVFAKGLNFPTGIAFKGNSKNFEVYVLESGHGLPSKCNEQGSFGTGDFDPNNPADFDRLLAALSPVPEDTVTEVVHFLGYDSGSHDAMPPFDLKFRIPSAQWCWKTSTSIP